MNERIAKLASKSGFDVGIHEGLILGNFSDMYKLAKFAELIVRECAKTIEDVHGKDLGDYLKEVFGVEE